MKLTIKWELEQLTMENEEFRESEYLKLSTADWIQITGAAAIHKSFGPRMLKFVSQISEISLRYGRKDAETEEECSNLEDFPSYDSCKFYS